MATERSVTEYASAAWTPWLSKTSQEKLEKAQLHAARTIIGLVKSTPREAVLIEANLRPLKERHDIIAITTLDRWLHLEQGDARRETAEREIQRRTGKDS